MSGLRRRGIEALPTFHMIELLDASIRNIPPAVLIEQQTCRQ
jgi:glycolate oxidase iron-sulfur subunit